MISELHLHGITGIELAEKLAADKKDLLFTLLVGHGDAAVAVEAMQGHVFNFSLKPVSADGLRGLVALAYAQYYDVDLKFPRTGRRSGLNVLDSARRVVSV